MPTDTFPIASDNDDGDGHKKAASWAGVPGAAYVVSDGDPASVFKSLFAGDFYDGNVFFRWDTSSIPDTATVTGANLLVYVTDKASPDSPAYAADFYDFGGTPSVDADWEQTSSGDAITTFDAAGVTVGVVNTIALTGLTGINLSGFTGLRLAPKDTTQPTGDNFIEMAMFPNANQEPRLEVTYTLPATGASVAWITA